MMSSGKANPYGGGMAGKSIKEKRIEFELNQSNIQQNKGFSQEVAEVEKMVYQPV